jgi:hypothetical protein
MCVGHILWCEHLLGISKDQGSFTEKNHRINFMQFVRNSKTAKQHPEHAQLIMIRFAVA